MTDQQEALFDDEPSPATQWDRDSASRALDDLFSRARRFNWSRDYHELLKFIARFTFYSPFNAMLAHQQMPGATFVAPPYRWERDFRRYVRPGARPVVLLQPRGPVLFTFDVSDTDPYPDAKPLPRAVERPFAVRRGRIGGQLTRTTANAARDGVSVSERDAGSQSAGQIARAKPGRIVQFRIKDRPEPVDVPLPLRYELLLNTKHSAETRYATLVHELAHLYCGHLGTPDKEWWPDRTGLSENVREFEAESVCYLVCERLGIENPSAEYLSGYVVKYDKTPAISLDCVMKSAGLIEQMGLGRMKQRKAKEPE